MRLRMLLLPLRMIIESGFDLHELMFGPFQEDDWRVVIACLDKELRLRDLTTIAPRYAGSIDAHRDEIIAAIDDSTAYFAIGHRIPDGDQHQAFYREYEMESTVVDELEQRGLRFLGHQVHDSEYWGSSGPAHNFDGYVGDETIPRILIVPGPHPFLDCRCLVCGPKNAAIEETRRRHTTTS